MVRRKTTRVAVVGGGPRGTSAVERLLANVALDPSERALAITVLDPFAPGPGRVWRPEQSRLFLMNTQSFYPTVIPSDSALARPIAGESFEEWRRRRGHEPGLLPTEAQELAGLGASEFPSRALYGRYLTEQWRLLVDAAPSGVTIKHLAREARSLTLPDDGTRFRLGLDDGGTLDADAVVLALGHVPSRLTPAQRELAAAADRSGLLYFPPAAPADVDWDTVPDGEPVLVRGMGLNFFDVLGQLTEGRGGRFRAVSDSRLTYLPSGREPQIIAASRRGTPYRGKAELSAYYAPGVALTHLHEDFLERFGDAVPSFELDLWPLLHRDMVRAYYATLARTRPEAVEPGLVDRLDTALAVPGAAWMTLAEAVVATGVPEGLRLDLDSLAAPLRGWHAADRAELDARVLRILDEDAAASGRGEDDPLKAAIAALHRGRAVLKEIVADGGITEDSWVTGLRGWFEAFAEGLASGPPSVRIRQLAALMRAGVVRTVGPEPTFAVDRARGVFTAASPWVGGPPEEARVMVEALAPSNVVAESDSPLLEQLLASGLARPKYLAGSDGVPRVSSGLDVTAPPYRVLDVDGRPVEGLYVLGLQLSSVQWGTAIAAESGFAVAPGQPGYRSGQRTLRDADAVARDILG